MAPILLVTRPKDSAESFAEKVLSGLDGEITVLKSPAFEIVPLDVEPNLTAEHLILTSSNGALQAKRLGYEIDGTVWCIGDRTTEVARTHDFSAVKAGNCAIELIETILKDRPNGRIVHVSGRHTRGDIVENLAAQGLTAERVVAYDQRSLEPTSHSLEALMGTLPIVLPLFSPRSAGLLARHDVTAPLHIVAMSDAVEAEVPHKLRKNVTVVQSPDEAQMVESTISALSNVM